MSQFFLYLSVYLLILDTLQTPKHPDANLSTLRTLTPIAKVTVHTESDAHELDL